MRTVTIAVVGLILVAGGCKKKQPTAAADPAPAKPPEEKVDDRNTNFRKDGSVLANAARAGKRAAALNDFDQLRTLIFSMELESNKMPDAAAIKTAMKTDAPNLYKLIDEGAIILTGTKDRAKLWAYEVDADKAGGIVIHAGNVSRATADEVKQYLEK